MKEDEGPGGTDHSSCVLRCRDDSFCFWEAAPFAVDARRVRQDVRGPGAPLRYVDVVP